MATKKQEQRDFLVMLREGSCEDSPWILLSTGRGKSRQLFTLSEAAAETARNDGFMVRIVPVYRCKTKHAHTLFPPTREETQRYKMSLRVRRSVKGVDEPSHTVPDYHRDVLHEGARQTEPTNIPETDTVTLRRVVPAATTARRNRTSTEVASD